MIQNECQEGNRHFPEIEKSSEDACNLDRAVDTLAALLRDFGANAFDLPEMDALTLRSECEQWAKHILFAAPPPGKSAPSREGDGGKRDWNTLRAFFQQRRHQESDYVTNALTGMRQVIWTCVNELHQSLLGENRADDRMQAQTQRLQKAAQTNNLLEIKQEVLSAVTAMNQIMQEQREQHRLRMEALHSHIRELDSLLAEARKESSLDALTCLFNRKAFTEQLARARDMAGVFGEPVCLFIVDADHFKAINDSYGHPAGDTTLRALADCLARTFPGSHDCVARYGGEEFAVICPDMTLEEGQRMAERLLRTVRGLVIRHEDAQIKLTVSVGLASVKPGEETAAWIERADRALYSAKQQGRNRFIVCG